MPAVALALSWTRNKAAQVPRNRRGRCQPGVMGSMGTLVTDTPKQVATDASAFDTRFAEARGRLVRICVGMVGADSADDVVQDAYLRARSRQSQLRDPDLFEAWLTRIAINLCMNRHRSRRRWLEKLPMLAGRQPVAPSRDAGLRELIGRLPSRERTLVVLHYGHGYSLEEVARMSGLAATNVRSIVFRARKRLRKQLEEANR